MGLSNQLSKAPKIATLGAYRATRAAPLSNHPILSTLGSCYHLSIASLTFFCSLQTSHLSQHFQFSGAFKFKLSLSMFLALHTAVDPSPCNRPLANAMASPAVASKYISRPWPRPSSHGRLSLSLLLLLDCFIFFVAFRVSAFLSLSVRLLLVWLVDRAPFTVPLIGRSLIPS